MTRSTAITAPASPAPTDRVSVLYIVRHGETQWNVAGRVQGHGDSPLTTRGQAQARANGALLARLGGVVEMRVSPLGRTRQTAALLLEQHPEPHPRVSFEPALMERHSGTWEGLTGAQIAARDPALWDVRNDDPYHHRPPGGESHVDLEHRTAELVAELQAHLAGRGSASGPMAVVTHGVLGRVLIKRLLGLDPTEAMRVLQPNHLVYRLEAKTVGPDAGQSDIMVSHFLNGRGPRPGLMRH